MTASPPQPDRPASTSGGGPPARARRRRTRAIRGSAIVLLLLALAWVVVTRSPLTRAMIVPRLERAMGVPVSAGSVTISLGGRIVLSGVRVSVPALKGPEAHLLSVDRLSARVDWLRGPSITHVVLRRPVFRLSQSIEDGTLNVAKLRFFFGGAPGAPQDLPTIAIEEATVELGEHDAQAYTPLASLKLAGSLTPAGDPRSPVYAVKFAELAPDATPTGPLRLSGRIAPDELRLTLEGLKLGRFGPNAVPTPLRKLYAGLDLQGRLDRATFLHRFSAGYTLSLEVNGVSVTPPFALQEDAPPVRLRNTTGSIVISRTGLEADLHGFVEDLPYDVRFEYRGTRPDAPFEARVVTRGYAIGKEPLLFRQLPELPRQYVLAFSGPTAIVDAFAIVSRAPPTPDAPAPIKVAGRLDFRDGWASYADFPYPFRDMSGTVEFTDSSITLRRIEGVAESGGVLTATGTIEPLTDEAAVDLTIGVAGVPLDDRLRTGLGPTRARILDALLSEDRLEDLRSRGLLGEGFEIGGLANVEVGVQREPGPVRIWHTDIRVSLPEVTFLPDWFALPLTGRDVLLHIDDDSARLLGGEFRSPDGTPLRISASTPVPDADDPDGEYLPTVSLVAEGLPITPLLVHALPEAAKLPDGRRLAEILDELDIEGMLDATLRVAPRPDGTLGFDALADLAGVSVSPPAPPSEAAPVRLRLTDATGELFASERRATLSLAGTPRIVAGESGAGRIAIDLEARYLDHPEPGLECVVGVDRLDARAPVEDACRVFSGAIADSIASLRERTRPDGVVSGEVLIEIPAEGFARGIEGEWGAPGVRLTLQRPLEISLDALDGRITLSNPSRPARIGFEGEPHAIFDDVEVDVAFAPPGEVSAPVGRARANGSIPLGLLTSIDRADPPPPAQEAHELRLALSGVSLDSPLVASLAGRFARAGILETVERAQIRGIFDAELTLAVDPDVRKGALALTGSVRPRSLRLVRPRAAIAADVLAGEIGFEDGYVRFEGLELSAPEWSAALSGSWAPAPAGEGGDLEVDFTLDAGRLTDDLRALLPEALADALEEIRLGVEGPLRLRDGALRIERGAGTGGDRIAFDARATFRDASFEPGLRITSARGGADIDVDMDEAGTRYRADVRLDRARALGVLVTDLETSITSGHTAGEVLIPAFAGWSHDGRVTGFAHVRPLRGAPSRREYLLSLELSGVRFHPVVAEMRGALLPEGAGGEPAESEATQGDSLLTGSLRLSGLVGEEGTRRGRGLFEVFGGRVIDLPLAVRVIEASNLAFPRNDRLDYARAEVFVEGPVAAFEDLSAFSDTIGIIGRGTMTIPEMEVDLRFHSRAARRIPLLSPLIETIRAELATTRVTGRIGEHEIRLEQFANRGRALDDWLSARRLAQNILTARKRGDVSDRAEAVAPIAPGR